LPRSLFDQSTQRWLAIHQLLLLLVQSNRWPKGQQEWRILLTSLVCSTPEQVAEFDRRFDLWTSSGAFRQKGNLPLLSFAIIPGAGMRAYVIALAVMIAGFVWALQNAHSEDMNSMAAATEVQAPFSANRTNSSAPLQFHTESIRVLDEHGKVATDARVEYAGRSEHPNKSGTFTLSVPQGASVPVFISRPLYHPTVAFIPSAKPVTLQPFAIPDSWFQRNFETIRVSIAFAPPLLVFVWWVWLERHRAQLRRWASTLRPDLRRVQIGRAGNRLFRRSSFNKAARDLRRLLPLNEELWPEATVEATAKSGGLLTPIFRKQKITKEYLLLTERLGARDHQARLNTELALQLRDRGVYVDLYFFHTDARISYREGKPEPTYSLEELVARNPQHTFWYGAEPNLLLDFATGEPKAWTNLLGQWSERVALGLATHREFGTLNFQTFAPISEDLERLAAGEAASLSKVPDVYPDLLRDTPERFLEREPPTLPTVAQLCAQLRSYLGSQGFDVMTHCALYPDLAFSITRHFAEELIMAEALELTLTKLVRLPWFRHGHMPDWLRERLLNGLSPRARARGLESLAICLERLGREDQAEIGMHSTGRRALGKGPQEDYIFRSLVLGGKLDSLAIREPRRWRQELFHYGDIRFGLQPRIWAGASILFVLLGWFTLPAFRQQSQAASIANLDPFLSVVLAVSQSEMAHNRAFENSNEYVEWCLQTASQIIGKSVAISKAKTYTAPDLSDNAGLVEPGLVALGKNSLGIVQSADKNHRNFSLLYIDSATHQINTQAENITPKTEVYDYRYAPRLRATASDDDEFVSPDGNIGVAITLASTAGVDEYKHVISDKDTLYAKILVVNRRNVAAHTIAVSLGSAAWHALRTIESIERGKSTELVLRVPPFVPGTYNLNAAVSAPGFSGDTRSTTFTVIGSPVTKLDVLLSVIGEPDSTRQSPLQLRVEVTNSGKYRAKHIATRIEGDGIDTSFINIVDLASRQSARVEKEFPVTALQSLEATFTATAKADNAEPVSSTASISPYGRITYGTPSIPEYDDLLNAWKTGKEIVSGRIISDRDQQRPAVLSLSCPDKAIRGRSLISPVSSGAPFRIGTFNIKVKRPTSEIQCDLVISTYPPSAHVVAAGKVNISPPHYGEYYVDLGTLHVRGKKIE
jgi:hypothetical protein